MPNAETASRGRGRPPLLTEELALAIAKMIRVYGLSDTRAGLLAGASSSSISRWKQESEEFSDFLEAARAEFERNRVLALLDATKPDGTPDWRAQAWLLRNASREGGWGKAAKPLRQASAKKAENLPENPAATSPEPPAASPAPASPTAESSPGNRGTPGISEPVLENPKSVPKIGPAPQPSETRLGETQPATLARAA